MKFRISPLVALAVALSGINLTAVQAAHHEEEHTELGEKMEAISKTFRSLRRDARDPANNARCADNVAKMLAGAKAALDHTPAWASEQPADQQDAFIAGYNKEMKVFVGLLTDLEKAFRADDNDAAKGLIEDLRDQQRKSHKLYKAPDED